MRRLTQLLLATALALPAAAAVAQDSTNHEVRVERHGFYPAKIYVEEGDTITFTNESVAWVGIYSIGYNDNYSNYLASDPCDENDADGDGQVEFAGEKDGFVLPWFNVGQTATVTVTSCMETQFYEPYFGSSYTFDGSKRFNLIVFGNAPNG